MLRRTGLNDTIRLAVFMIVIGIIALMAFGIISTSPAGSAVSNTKTDVDARRLAQTYEVADHRRPSVFCVNYERPYESVTVDGQRINLVYKSGDNATVNVATQLPKEEATVSEFERLCVINDEQTLSLQKDTCETVRDCLPNAQGGLTGIGNPPTSPLEPNHEYESVY